MEYYIINLYLPGNQVGSQSLQRELGSRSLWQWIDILFEKVFDIVQHFYVFFDYIKMFKVWHVQTPSGHFYVWTLQICFLFNMFMLFFVFYICLEGPNAFWEGMWIPLGARRSNGTSRLAHPRALVDGPWAVSVSAGTWRRDDARSMLRLLSLIPLPWWFQGVYIHVLYILQIHDKEDVILNQTNIGLGSPYQDTHQRGLAEKDLAAPTFTLCRTTWWSELRRHTWMMPSWIFLASESSGRVRRRKALSFRKRASFNFRHKKSTFLSTVFRSKVKGAFAMSRNFIHFHFFRPMPSRSAPGSPTSPPRQQMNGTIRVVGSKPVAEQGWWNLAENSMNSSHFWLGAGNWNERKG